jgi:hypothetical protein
MSLKQPAMAIAAAVICAVIGSASASAQEDCGNMYNRVLGAYQAQSPYYTQMLNHYNARCLSGASAQPTWSGDNRYWYGHDRRGYDDHRGYDNDRRRYDNNGWRWGW